MNFTQLVGERVRLRIFQQEDITEHYIGWLNDPAVTRFSNQRFRRHDRQSCSQYFQTFADTENIFVSIRTIAGTAIGTMTAYRNPNHSTADLGIMIGDRSMQGKGAGLEAWALLAGWLLGPGETRKITAGMLDCNLAMIKLAERSGMTLEGRRVAQEIVDGQPQDILYYGKFGG
jgi:ribosomal-protein-alanine N-acetyltransferase